jgi:hypothetical protein
VRELRLRFVVTVTELVPLLVVMVMVMVAL